MLRFCHCLLAPLATTAALYAAAPLIDLDVRVPMRDGVRLAANVYRPASPARVPVIVIRTPYGKGLAPTPNHLWWVDRGYAIVIQDLRGRHASDGVFRPLDGESLDGYDTLTWAARQPWSDGNLGMMGGSYLGMVQWQVLPLGHPRLKAISPLVSGFDEYRDRFYSPGGAMRLGHRMLWLRDNFAAAGHRPPPFDEMVRHVPLRDIDRYSAGRPIEFLQRALDHPVYDAYWKPSSIRQLAARICTPVLSFTGWYDTYAPSDLDAFQSLHAQGVPVRLIAGPWPHNFSIKFPDADFGPAAELSVREVQLGWFDHWLKGKPLPPAPPLRLFVMGSNTWRDATEWPPRAARIERFYLRADRLLSTTAPSKPELPIRFTYDPRDPVPTRGGANCCNPAIFPWGPIDQRDVEHRPDVVSYSTAPLDRDVEVTGPIRVSLAVSTSAPDTDFTAKLVDVHPSGRAVLLTDGILRLRYRESIERETPARPGEIYDITIDAGVTANLFKKGHRIRVEISSSNFPRFDRNPNTGRPIAAETKAVRATQTIHHDRAHPSYVSLPVIR